MAFHEKAGRSQGNSGFIVSFFFFVAEKSASPAELATVAMFPFALSKSDSFRSVQVGRSRFSRCCYLISDLSFHSRVERGPGHRRSHRNSALALSFLFQERFGLCFCRLVLPFGFMPLPPLSLRCCCATVRTLHHSPTGDAATPPAFSPWQQWPVSSRSSRRARPVSVPSA